MSLKLGKGIVEVVGPQTLVDKFIQKKQQTFLTIFRFQTISHLFKSEI